MLCTVLHCGPPLHLFSFLEVEMVENQRSLLDSMDPKVWGRKSRNISWKRKRCFPLHELMLKRRQGDQATDYDQSLVHSTMVSAAGPFLGQNNCPMGMRHISWSPAPSDEQAKPLLGCTTPLTVPAGTCTTTNHTASSAWL